MECLSLTAMEICNSVLIVNHCLLQGEKGNDGHIGPMGLPVSSNFS